MIDILFNTVTGRASLVTAAAIKTNADVPVRVTFSAGLGDMQGITAALGTDSDAPEVLAATDTFAQESATVWLGALDSGDARLLAFLAGKNAATVNLEVLAILDGKRQRAPNLPVTVQPSFTPEVVVESGDQPGTGDGDEVITGDGDDVVIG